MTFLKTLSSFTKNSSEFITGKTAHAASYAMSRAKGKNDDEARAAADIAANVAIKSVSKSITNKFGWKKPSFAKFENCKPLDPAAPEGDRLCKNVHKKRISRGYEMMNFQRENKKNGNNILNFESKKKRYWKLSNLGPNRKSVKNPNYKTGVINEKNPEYIPFQASTYKNYIANNAPALFGFTENRYINHRNNAFKIKQFQEAIEAKKSGNMAQGIDLQKYQELLQDPTTKKQAAEELNAFKQMLIDGRTMNREQLAAKISKVEFVAKIASGLGMVLGAASGTGAVTATLDTAVKEAGQVIGAASTLVSAGVEGASTQHRLRAITSVLKTGLGIGAKVAVGAVVGTVLGVSGAGFPLVVIAAVAATGAVAAHQYGKHLTTKKLATEVSGEELIKLITEMIQNDGVIEETNPMFLSQKRVKNLLNDSIIARLNRNENINTILSSIKTVNEVNADNIKNADILLAQMKNVRKDGYTYNRDTKEWSPPTTKGGNHKTKKSYRRN